MSLSGGISAPPGPMGYTPPKRMPMRLDALGGGNAGATDERSPRQAQPTKPKRERRKRGGIEDPRVHKLMSEVKGELQKLSSAVPGGMLPDPNANQSPPTELAPFLQDVLGGIKETRGRLGAVYIDDSGGGGAAAPAAKDNSKEMGELMAQMKSMESENNKLRRYGQRAKTAVEKLQSERGRMAADLAQAEFKLKEANAGRGGEADKLFDPNTNKKTEKMLQWEKKHAQNVPISSGEEQRLRERFEQEKSNVAEMRQSGGVESEGGAGGAAAPTPAAPGEGGFVMQQCDQ